MAGFGINNSNITTFIMGTIVVSLLIGYLIALVPVKIQAILISIVAIGLIQLNKYIKKL